MDISMVELNRIKQRIGNLEVIERVIWSSPPISYCWDWSSLPISYYWVCRCDCGNMRMVEEKRLDEGTITMCVGCDMKKNKGKLNVNFH